MGMWLRHWLAGGGSVAAVLIITGTAALGLVLGSIRLGRVRLGIAGVLFAGLLLGHLQVRVGGEVLDFARDFGLVLFVYCVGVQVGPGFVSSFRSKGLAMNLVAAGVVFSGAALAVAIGKLGRIPMPVAVGLFSGATTNTPSLGAAQTALGELPHYTDEMGSLPRPRLRGSLPLRGAGRDLHHGHHAQVLRRCPRRYRSQRTQRCRGGSQRLRRLPARG